ncbi:asparaginase [Dactylosporangium sp. CA-233914]|uniref:asparaginase n=1 Tax=Dactylosporangium sp. CA-233914 TaxID=3239934 RepID=UPI003D8A3205
MSDLYAGGALIAEVVRSEVVESRHHGSVVLLGADGEIAASAGDVLGAVFPRSSAKPLQAVGMLRTGLQVAPADLALVAASHRGQEAHISGVRRMLRESEIPLGALGCPPDYPLAEDARDAVVRAGHGREPVFMNCSGKHAGMLRTAKANGWALETYLDPGHPLQLRLTATIEELVGEPARAIGVDGCGAPLLAYSLRGLARAFLHLVSAPAGSHERAVADAMRAYPALVSGDDAVAARAHAGDTARAHAGNTARAHAGNTARAHAGNTARAHAGDTDDTRLMRAVPGLLLKSGAEGVAAAALPGVGAVAIKIDDGGARARFPVLAAAFARLGVNLPGQVPVFGGGREVGVVRSVW